MEHKDDTEQRPAHETPQSVWQSLDQQEEPGMEMSLTTDQLCARARYRERENIWFQWIAAVPCLALGATCVYWTVTMGQIWFRLAAAWLAVLMAHALWGSIRVGARRFRAGESCTQFMVRELEGSRRTLLALQWGMVLVLPSLSMFWWGAYREMQASGLRLLDPSAWQHSLLTILWSIVGSLLVLLATGVGLGLEAKKRARQAEELRHAIGMRE
jgi:hypothetical protein